MRKPSGWLSRMWTRAGPARATIGCRSCLPWRRDKQKPLALASRDVSEARAQPESSAVSPCRSNRSRQPLRSVCQSAFRAGPAVSTRRCLEAVAPNSASLQQLPSCCIPVLYCAARVSHQAVGGGLLARHAIYCKVCCNAAAPASLDKDFLTPGTPSRPPRQRS